MTDRHVLASHSLQAHCPTSGHCQAGMGTSYDCLPQYNICR